jgi:retron-type reverse transcriptase
MTITPSFLSKLAKAYKLTETDIKRLVARAPHTYKTYEIPKKSGGKRTIAQPAKETKIIQNWIIKTEFKGLPVSNSASAYKSGSSIKINALKHRKNRYLLKMDFKNFFESIDETMVKEHLLKYLKIPENDAAIISRVCCFQKKHSKKLSLSIGAPSSPILSNSIMYKFDAEIENWCRLNAAIYTRYADDLFISTNQSGRTADAEQFILKLTKELLPKLDINKNKTKHLSKKCNRTITGLVITNEGGVSLGRDKKRNIRRSLFLHQKGLLDKKQLSTLQGELGFAKHIDPAFITTLNNKFGNQFIHAIFTHRE